MAAKGLSWKLRFVLSWPDVERRLLGLLRRRGASPATAEDIAQEVAIRALRSEPDFETADQLFWWSSTVGCRLLIDDHRKTSRAEPMAEVPDRRLAEDPAAEAERAETVRVVLAEFGRLPLTQQEAFGVAGSRAAPSTNYVRRFRARARLRAAVEALGALWLWLNRRGTAGSPSVEPAMTLAAVTLAMSGLAVVGLGVVPDGGGGPSSGLVADAPAAEYEAARLIGSAVRSSATSDAPGSSGSADGDGITIDPPAKVAVQRNVPPRGVARAEVEERHDDPPLLCLNLTSTGLVRCVDYPVRPE